MYIFGGKNIWVFLLYGVVPLFEFGDHFLGAGKHDSGGEGTTISDGDR